MSSNTSNNNRSSNNINNSPNNTFNNNSIFDTESLLQPSDFDENDYLYLLFQHFSDENVNKYKFIAKFKGSSFENLPKAAKILWENVSFLGENTWNEIYEEKIKKENSANVSLYCTCKLLRNELIALKYESKPSPSSPSSQVTVVKSFREEEAPQKEREKKRESKKRRIEYVYLNAQLVNEDMNLMAFHKNLPFIKPTTNEQLKGEFIEMKSKFIFSMMIGCISNVLEKHYKNINFDDDNYNVPNEYLPEFLVVNFTCLHKLNKTLPEPKKPGITRVALPAKISVAIFDIYQTQIERPPEEKEKERKERIAQKLQDFLVKINKILESKRSELRKKIINYEESSGIVNLRWKEVEWKYYKKDFDSKMVTFVKFLEQEIDQWSKNFSNAQKQNDWTPI